MLRPLSIVVSAMALTLLLASPAASARGRSEGEEILVTGTVTDPSGDPVAGVSVEIRASRLAFSMRDFRIARRGSRRAAATSNEGGVFEIAWEWHPYYNRFELVAGIPSDRSATGESLVILDSVDLSRRMKTGNPVVATLEIPDREPVDSLNEFLAGLDSADKLEVYQEVGKPDKVRHTVLPSHRETSWWYFELGRVYRFRDGTSQGVDHFEPIIEPSS